MFHIRVLHFNDRKIDTTPFAKPLNKVSIHYNHKEKHECNHYRPEALWHVINNHIIQNHSINVLNNIVILPFKKVQFRIVIFCANPLARPSKWRANPLRSDDTP